MAKKQSSSYATGGGGFQFEACVQGSYVIFMAIDSVPPFLDNSFITEIRLQTKQGYQTDDMLVICENRQTKKRSIILVNIKSSIKFTKSNKQLSEVFKAVWIDYNNDKLFTKGQDQFFLLTGSLNDIDSKTIPFICNQAKCQKDYNSFIEMINKKGVSPPKSKEKLEVIQHHLKKANNGNEITLKEVYEFLKYFTVISYDFNQDDYSVMLWINQTNIPLFNSPNSDRKHIWARIIQYVQQCNKHGGVITKKDLPEDIKTIFIRKNEQEIPEGFTHLSKRENKTIDKKYSPYLARLIFIGFWDASNNNDIAIIGDLMPAKYQDWRDGIKEIKTSGLEYLTVKNGIWQVNNRIELVKTLAEHIFDDDLELLAKITLQILQEVVPDIDRLNYSNKSFKYSQEIRQGIADGIAILSIYKDNFKSCTRNKRNSIGVHILNNLLEDATWQQWASLNHLLPSLAEVDPDIFLRIVDTKVNLEQSPFDELFAKETNVFSSHHMTGLLWALEGLAWKPEYLMQVCIILGKLAIKDPGGQLGNRPFNSLKTILLPWKPQTLADITKIKAVVETLIKEVKAIACKFLLLMISGAIRATSDTHQTKWRNYSKQRDNITHGEYREQVDFYAEQALEIAGDDVNYLQELIKYFPQLNQKNFNKLSKVVTSNKITKLAENKRLPLWEQLIKLVRNHEKYSDAYWALPSKQVTKLEKLASKIQPQDLFCLHHELFTNDDFHLYEDKVNYEAQRKALQEKRDKAIKQIFHEHGIAGIIKFNDEIKSQYIVGYSLGVLSDEKLEQHLLPNFLDKTDFKDKNFINGYIERKQQTNNWCNKLNKNKWTTEQICQFLVYLPFTQTTWQLVDTWLANEASKYWENASINCYNKNEDLSFAIDKLLGNHRFALAIKCLGQYENKNINTDQCIKALTGLKAKNINDYTILRLIEFLQNNHTEAEKQKIINIEWKFIKLFNNYGEDYPKLLETKMAEQPEFFVEKIKLYPSSNNTYDNSKVSAEQREKACSLLHNWQTIPGLKQGKFYKQEFNNWFKQVKTFYKQDCSLSKAIEIIGGVLFYAPKDASGLWINKDTADILNQSNSQDILNSFINKMHNSTGFLTSSEHKELANKYRKYAEDSENSGFLRLATALKGLAKFHDDMGDEFS